MQPSRSDELAQSGSTNQQIVEAGKQDSQNGAPAHEAAEADMLKDPELNNTAGPDDGLDEGELAKLEGED